MKKNLFTLLISILFVFVSCRKTNEEKNNEEVKTDTLQSYINKKEIERKIKRKEIEKQKEIDSINLDKILKKAIIIANNNISINKFKKEYVETMPDSLFLVEISISSDFYFSNEVSHFIIKRNTPDAIYIDIFSKEDKKVKKVLSHEQWNMTYRNDTIQDINGDGLKDFVVNWYGATGCCLKAFSNIYLLRKDKISFSKNFEFINPTFSPKEKIIRGVCYGHPGNTEMYKYKWNGENVDTLEYVSFERNENGRTGKIIISNRIPFEKNFKILKKLNSVPSEYKKIEGYDWFNANEFN